MEDLARRGFTGVLHTFSENDLNYYRDQMRRIVEVSHEVRLEVQVNPWGLGHAFGGEAESLFVATRPEVSQVFDDGRSVGAGCPNRPEFRAFVRSCRQDLLGRTTLGAPCPVRRPRGAVELPVRAVPAAVLRPLRRADARRPDP
jgi:hypothetical protein